tara:strand:- start:12611 stop:13429 length:819 start_codon:yes stop_codon:yes gene_type:complete
MFNKLFNKIFNKKLTINLTATLLLVSQISFAQTSTQIEQVSSSVGETKSKIDSEKSEGQTQRTLAFKGMNRTEVTLARQQKAKEIMSTSSTSQSVVYSSNFYHSFSIYTGYSQLITDIDEDGYYQAFSVAFDADLLSPMANEQAVVYADLYLSQNGGPWVLYFSTDDFVITGEYTDDEFEVVTKLDSGYVPDYYDVLIDLYEVGYSDVVATYSSNDSNELYALPLESSDFDPEYIAVEYVEVEYYEEHSGGGIWLLLGALLALGVRLLKMTK